MAEFDDKSHEVPNESENDISHPPAESDDTQKQGGAIAGVVTLFFIIGFVGSLVVGWIVFPKLLYSQKHQPINFNHAVHVEMVENSCESCHYFREDGSFSGIPQNAACVECHQDIQGETEDERIFFEEYVAKDREVPWLVYSRQPDCVFFSHAAHVKMGEMDCVTCHGHIGESETSRVYEENRITGYSRDIWGRNIAGFKQNPWDRMKMNDCADCHRLNNVNQNSVQTQRGGCFKCHQ
jgi:hypothetical protein